MAAVSTRILIATILVVAGVGALDGFISREWDLLAVFLLVITLETVLWLRLRANRIPVTIRPDLARWIEQQSEQTGEPFDDLIDRAIAWHRSGLYPAQVDVGDRK